jgi:hypothetical protein
LVEVFLMGDTGMVHEEESTLVIDIEDRRQVAGGQQVLLIEAHTIHVQALPLDGIIIVVDPILVAQVAVADEAVVEAVVEAVGLIRQAKTLVLAAVLQTVARVVLMVPCLPLQVHRIIKRTLKPMHLPRINVQSLFLS